MSQESELFYVCRPAQPRTPPMPVEFLAVSEFLTDESACRALWELVSTQFRTRGKFLAVWPGVRFVALHRNDSGETDGFLLVSTPVNWHVDYVVVRPEARGRGIAAALLAEAVGQAHRRGVPFVTLTSKPALRSLYGSCGFVVAELKAEALACDDT
jgi:GNAT superfamily N-acetyltransferase